MAVGFIVQIDWSQTDKTYVFVEGAKTREQAKELVKKSCNCPRIYVDREIERIIKVPTFRKIVPSVRAPGDSPG